MMKIAVLFGGRSKEREISLKSGKAIAEALKRKSYDVLELDTREKDFIQTLIKEKVEKVYLALHGRYGEDGSIQGMLEYLEIPYTGSSILSSSLCFDKKLTKDLLVSEDVLTPESLFYDQKNNLDNFIKIFREKVEKSPWIVKPNTEGSTLGMTLVKNPDDCQKAMELALSMGPQILIEEYIEGREVTSAVFEGKAYPLVEIKAKSGFYDFEAKYTSGQTEYLVPAPLDKDLSHTITQTSLKIYEKLQCAGAVRIDYMISKSEEAYFLEVNTIPGMTETSLLPKAAAEMGLGFDDLCEQILKTASLKTKI